MLANFFSKAKPINYVLLTFLFIILYIFAFVNANITVYTLNIILLKLADIFLFMFLMFLYDFIIYKNNLNANNHYGILIISLLFGGIYPILIHTKTLFALVFLAMAFRRIYSLNIHNDIKNKLFDSGFLIAISSLLFQDNALFIILIYFAILIFRHLKWNYFFIPVIGFLTPYFLIYSYSLGVGNWGFFKQITTLNLSFSLDIFKNQLFLNYILIIIVLCSFSYVLFTLKSKVFSNKFKSLWILVFEHFVLSLLLLFLGNKDNFYNSAIIIFPTSIIIANYIQVISKNWVKEVLIFLIVGLSISSIIYSLLP